MSKFVSLLVALGLLAFGVAVMLGVGVANDPYQNRKFNLGKGVAVRVIIGAIVLLMGAVQLYLWFGGRL